MEEHRDIVKKLDGWANVHYLTLRTDKCPGKAELEIDINATGKSRLQDEIREVIGDWELFFGIPYSLVSDYF